MKLKDLKARIDQAYKNAGTAADQVDVEVWHNDEMFTIENVGQFHVVPDVSISVKKKKGE